MKPQLSPLKLIDFAIVNCSLSFITPSNNKDFGNLTDSYLIDVDYAITIDSGKIKVLIKASINENDDSIEGYKIFAEGIAIFELSKDATLRIEDAASLVNYSSVSIAINSLRGFISNLTAQAPFGRYILPSIDVQDLFKQKIDSLNTSGKSPKPTKNVSKKTQTKSRKKVTN
jgi:preprotein translocase subunit SecB